MTDLEALIVATVERSILNAPRSLQTAIGPSELGTPCERQLGYKLAGVPEVRSDVAWKPFVGTAMHGQFEVIFTNADMANDPPQWMLEQVVTVGDINGQPVTGHADAYHVPSGAVVDWKFVGLTPLKDYRRGGPGRRYREQAHLYGRGFAALGYRVRTVAIMFWTRAGEFHDRYLWSEPYDEAVALAALARATDTAQLLDALTPQVAIPLLPTADGPCSWCGWWRPNSTDLATACPGDPATHKAAPTTLADALGN